MFPIEQHQILRNIMFKLKKGRIILFVVLLITILLVNSVIFVTSYKRIANFLQGPYELTSEDLQNLINTKDFDVNKLDRSYFKVKFGSSDKFFVDFFIADWEWGTEDSKSKKFTGENAFAFLYIYDETEQKLYIFHARVKSNQVEKFYDNYDKEITLTLNRFPDNEKNFIYSRSDLLQDTTKKSLDLTNKYDKYYNDLYTVVSSTMKEKKINFYPVFDYNYPSQSEALLILAIILIIETLILLLAGIYMVRGFAIPLESRLKRYLTDEEITKLNQELEKNPLKYSYRLRSLDVYFTDSFMVYSTNMIVIPYKNITYYRKVTQYYNGIKNGQYIEMKVKTPKDKIKHHRLMIFKEKDLDEMLILIQQRLQAK